MMRKRRKTLIRRKEDDEGDSKVKVNEDGYVVMFCSIRRVSLIRICKKRR